jgi:3',5'-cyclic AMP phosphodiesterase CpdA
MFPANPGPRGLEPEGGKDYNNAGRVFRWGIERNHLLRLALVSDLHVDITQKNWELVPLLAELLKIIEPDVFLICGDISPELGDVEYALDCFSGLSCTRLFVPGNQDIWIMSNFLQEEGHDSYEKYYFQLPGVCKRNGFIPLWMEPQVIRGVGFAGSIGWYDFSFRDDESVPQSLDATSELRNDIWNDLRWACWNDVSYLIEGEPGPFRRSDVEVARDFLGRLDNDLEMLAHTPGVQEMVVAMHHPPFASLVNGTTGDDNDYGSFMGSEEMGRMLLRHPKLSTVLCGHLHEKRDVMVENLRALCSPVGYLTRDQRKNIIIAEDALTVFHIIEGDDLLLL